VNVDGDYHAMVRTSPDGEAGRHVALREDTDDVVDKIPKIGIFFCKQHRS